MQVPGTLHKCTTPAAALASAVASAGSAAGFSRSLEAQRTCLPAPARSRWHTTVRNILMPHQMNASADCVAQLNWPCPGTLTWRTYIGFRYKRRYPLHLPQPRQIPLPGQSPHSAEPCRDAESWPAAAARAAVRRAPAATCAPAASPQQLQWCAQGRPTLAALLRAPNRQRQSCERSGAGIGPPRAPDASDEWRTSGFTQYLASTTDEFCWELSVRPCAGPAR